jgi:hypothetical protein
MSISRKFMAGSVPDIHRLLLTNDDANQYALEIRFNTQTEEVIFATLDTDSDQSGYAAVDVGGQRYWWPDYESGSTSYGRLKKRVIRPDGSTITTTHNYAMATYGNPVACVYDAENDLLFFGGYDDTIDRLMISSVNPDTMEVIDSLQVQTAVTTSSYYRAYADRMFIAGDGYVLWCHSRDGTYSFNNEVLGRSISYNTSTGVLGAQVDTEISAYDEYAGTVPVAAIGDRSAPDRVMVYTHKKEIDWHRSNWSWGISGIINETNYTYTGYLALYTASPTAADEDKVSGNVVVTVGTHRLDLWSPYYVADNYRLSEFITDYPELADMDEMYEARFLGDSEYMAMIFRNSNDYYLAVFSVDLTGSVINETVMNLVSLDLIPNVGGTSTRIFRLSYLFTQNDRA